MTIIVPSFSPSLRRAADRLSSLIAALIAWETAQLDALITGIMGPFIEKVRS